MKQILSIWKIAIVKAALMAFLAGYTTLQTSLNGLEWANISPTQKFILICGVLAAMATSMVAFLDRTMSRIEAEQKALAAPPAAPPATPNPPNP